MQYFANQILGYKYNIPQQGIKEFSNIYGENRNIDRYDAKHI